MGFTFMPVSGTSFKLKDFKATNMDPDSDCLQKLDPETTGAINYYTYFSAETAKEWEETEGEYDDCIGWWEVGKYGEAEFNRDNETINVGDGFLMLNAYHDISLTAAGEAPTTATELSFSTKSPFIANYLPVDMKLKDLTATGMDPDSDCLQKLDPETTGAINYYTYFSPETAEEWEETPGEYDDCIGWWEVGKYGDPEFNRDNAVVKAGEGFLVLNAYHDITINFKAATDIKAE